jgi:hypothetical protein
VGVHLAGEHAAELELGDALLDAGGVALEFGEARRILLGLDQLEQFGRVRDAGDDAVDLAGGRLEARSLAAVLLGAFRGVPDAGVLELAVQLLEPFTLAIVLKGTPSARGCAARDPSGNGVEGRFPWRAV